MGKIDMGIIYGKLYNSQTRTFLIRTGEKFIDETGPVCFLNVCWNLKEANGTACIRPLNNYKLASKKILFTLSSLLKSPNLVKS